MNNSEIPGKECHCCKSLDGNAPYCSRCWTKKSGFGWILTISIALAWIFTFVFGLFLVLGAMAALKHVKQDYSFMYYTALLFVLTLSLARWLPRLYRQ